MDMLDNEFDNFFRNKLEGFTSEVPEDMWERINPRKDDDRKPFFIWLLFSALMLLIISAGAYFIFSPQTKKTIISETNIKESEKKKATKDTETIIESNEMNVPKSNRTIKKEITEIKTTQKIFPTTENSTKKSNSSIQKINFKVGSNTINHQNIILNSVVKKKNYDKKELQNSTQKTDDVFLQENKSQSKTNVQQNKANASNNSIDVRSNQATKKVISPKDSTEKKTDTKPKKSITKSIIKKKNWYLDIYGSPVIPFDVENLISRNFSYSFGLRLSRQFGKHFSAKIGIGYTQLNYRAIDSMPINNRYSSIDIPLLLGYEIGNDYFKAAVNAGIDFDVYTRFTDLWIPNKQYFYFGLNFEEKLKNKISLFAEPYFKYHLTRDPNHYFFNSQKINIGGVWIGARYRF